MKKEIKLTPKQQQVLEGLADILARNNYKKVTVSDIHCNMTAVTKIVAPNWFDRTFNKLEELGLVEKEDMDFIVPGGYRKGVVEKTYTYNITELGLEYLGIDNPNEPVEEVKEVKPLEKSTTVVTPEQHKEKVIDAAQPMTKDMILPYKDSKSHISYKFVCKDCNTVIKSNEEYLYNPLTGCYHHKKCGGSHLILEINPNKPVDEVAPIIDSKEL